MSAVQVLRGGAASVAPAYPVRGRDGLPSVGSVWLGPVVLAESYPTEVAGVADRISCDQGEALVLLAVGGSSDFAAYLRVPAGVARVALRVARAVIEEVTP